MPVSAVVGPSRLVRRALCACALVHGAAAALVLAEAGATCGGPDAWPRAAVLAAACLFGAIALGKAARRFEMKRRIDISGPGTIGLTVQQSLGPQTAQRQPMRLLPATTIWAHCLLLHLEPEEGGGRVVLLIVPDSVGRAAFRPLAVAIRGVAGRDNKFSEKHKIL